ncbi:hypothetical protein [Erythrobacter aureus]|uniref:Type 4 secretion system PilS N-terminal domain-containing protein n=1 Tax=Erythrobacter aureus TaxID=2182384 RepID=A0A345YJK7_9SPHN|nr:hypothetical protein [Erythrobacter aureus]AXK44109.1 hypothetical protein DVR09_16790 [Erythrobacter aureus]
MSQVLIGIIGVILFIGLALAGAMFLGPRFQESANNSRASASLQAVAQISQAANMYQLQEGFAAANTGALTSGGYLKAVPVNPVSNANEPILVNYLGGTPAVMDHVEMVIGGNGDAGTGQICTAINKQATGGAGTPPTAQPTGATTDGVSGCYNDTTNNQYKVWARI